MKTRTYPIMTLCALALLLGGTASPVVVQAATVADVTTTTVPTTTAETTQPLPKSVVEQTVTEEQSENTDSTTPPPAENDSAAAADESESASTTQTATTETPSTPAIPKTAIVETTPAPKSDIDVWMPNKKFQQLVLWNLQAQKIVASTATVADITQADMAQLTTFSNDAVSGHYVDLVTDEPAASASYSLQGLEFAPNLTKVTLHHANSMNNAGGIIRGDVTDVSPLAGLAKLQSLDISGNRITSLAPLTELLQAGTLQELNASYNGIADFSMVPTSIKLELFQQVVQLPAVYVDPQQPTTTIAPQEIIKLPGNRSLSDGYSPNQLFYQYNDVRNPAIRLRYDPNSGQSLIWFFGNGVGNGSTSASGFDKITYEGLAPQQPGIDTYPGQPSLTLVPLPHLYYTVFGVGSSFASADFIVVRPYTNEPTAAASMTVHFQDEDGQQIAADQIINGSVGHSETVAVQEIAGYIKPYASFDVSLTATAQEKIVTYRAAIKTQDQTIYAGQPWQASDQLTRLLDDQGEPIDLSATDLATVSGLTTTITNSAGEIVSAASARETADTYTVTFNYHEHDFSSQLIVQPDLQRIDAHDSTIQVGDDWTPAANFDHAQNSAGEKLELEALEVNGSVDTLTAGQYQVTYALPSLTRAAAATPAQTTVTITVVPQPVLGKATIQVHDSTLSVGATWQAQENFDQATNAAGETVAFDQIKVNGQVDTSKAGVYRVTYAYADQQETATVTVTDQPTTVKPTLPQTGGSASTKPVTKPVTKPMATPVDQSVAKMVTDRAAQQALPKTSERTNSGWALAGGLLLTLAGWGMGYVLLRKRRS